MKQVNRRRALDCEINFDFAKSNAADPVKVAGEIEAALIDKASFRGNLFGKGECFFYVKGEPARVRQVVGEIADDLAISREALCVRERPHTPRPRARKPKLFDIFAVPLPNGEYGYAQFFGYDEERCADLVRAYSLTTDQPEARDAVILESGQRFPPVFTLLSVAQDTFGWRWVGNLPVEFSPPVFRQSVMCSCSGPGVFDDWVLWSSHSGLRSVGILTEAEQKLEFLATWSPRAIAERIITGKNPYDSVL